MQRLKTPYLLIGMILLIEALLFAPRQGAFVLDDNPSVLQNSLLLKSLPQAILSSPFRAVTVGVNWANLHAFGFDPQAFRQVNLALHLVMSLLLFFLIREFAENEKDYAAAVIGAGWFALNPLTNFAMSYISARSTVLATLWTIAALTAYLRFDKKGKPVLLAVALLSSIVAMLSKENGIVAPVMIAALGVIGVGARHRRLASAISFVVLAAIFMFLRLGHPIFPGTPAATPSSYHYFLTQMTIIPQYFLKFLWPVGLAIEQDVVLKTNPDTAVLAGAGGMAVIWGIALWNSRHFKPAAFFLLWLPISLAPESSFVPFADASFLHRAYMPAAGLAALVGFAVSGIIKHAADSRRKSIACAMTGTALSCFALASFIPAFDWSSKISVFRQNVRVSPDKYRARYDLGAALNNEFKYYAAWPHLEVAARIGAPTPYEDAETFNALGKSRYRRGDFYGALACFLQAAQNRPNWDDPFVNAGITFLRIGDPQKALQYLNRAVQMGNSNEQVRDAIKKAQEALRALPTNVTPDTGSP